jgi:hypothetical protein
VACAEAEGHVSLAQTSEAQVRHYVAQVRHKVPGARLIGIRTRGGWAGPDRITVDGADLPVIVGRSPLQVREALLGLGGDGHGAVLLTNLDERELGDDVVGRLARQRLHVIDSWQVVCELFGATTVDGRMSEQRWLADALLEVLPQNGPDPVRAGVLDYRSAWSALLRFDLDFDDEVLDLRALLEWALEPGAVERYRSAPDDLRSGLRDFLEDVAGSPARLITGCLEAGYGSRVVSIGLVCRSVFGQGDDESARRTAIRLESYVGEKDISPADALAWASEAEGVVLRRLASGDVAGATRLRALADEFLTKELAAPELARASHFLPSSFKQRLTEVAAGLDDVLLDGQAAIAPLERAAAHASAHVDARPREDLRSTLEMLPRLARWLVQPADGANDGFAAVARRYVDDGSFVDWARKVVWGSAPGEPLASSLARFGDAVRTRREAQSRAFASGLAAWSDAPSSKDLLPIEQVLDRIVVPLADLRPVLLLVLDGMGLAVFHELLADIETHGWIDLAPQDDPRPVGPVIAALPSVTEFSRASLLAGRVCRGDQQAEKLAFESHAGMRTKAASTHPPRLFHKSDLRNQSGGLAPALREALQDAKQRIVGVVVNAVDDHLDSGRQLNVRWTCGLISPLLDILDAAAEVGRVVVLTADHGHVIEHGTEKLADSEGERWRADDGAPRDGEIVLTGPRVLVPGRERVILPWSDGIRYGPKKGGYHGGASPQEVLVPLAVLSTPMNEVPGWTDLPPRTPVWWDPEPALDSSAIEPHQLEVPKAKTAAPAKAARARRTERQPDLFAGAVTGEAVEPPRTVVAATSDTSKQVHAAIVWIDILLASEVFLEQRERNKRQPITDDRVRTILAALEERGGTLTRTALARRLGLHEMRLRGTITALRRLLNVEGYDVLAEDESGATVTLNRELLFKQFGIGS